MDDLVEVGVFAAAEDGGPGEPLYLRMHRVRSGEQRITVTVPRKPARAGIDPRNLLIDVEPDDNLAEVARLPRRPNPLTVNSGRKVSQSPGASELPDPLRTAGLTHSPL